MGNEGVKASPGGSGSVICIGMMASQCCKKLIRDPLIRGLTPLLVIV